MAWDIVERRGRPRRRGISRAELVRAGAVTDDSGAEFRAVSDSARAGRPHAGGDGRAGLAIERSVDGRDCVDAIG
jgi:hypothetical protein